MISTVFKANIQNGKYKVYVSSDKYFHTKWCAYVAESDSHVKTLFTSANLTTDHLKPWQYGKKVIPNSVVTDDRMEKGIFENGVLGPQRKRCSSSCSIVKWDSQSKVFKPEYEAYEHSEKKQTGRSLDIPQNISSRLIYQKVVDFIQTVKTHMRDKPSGANHYIYLVSPFIIKTINYDSSIIDKLCEICCDRDGAASSDQAVLTTKIVHFHDRYSPESVKAKLKQIASKVRTSLARNKFHSKFIAWVRSDEVEVRILQTSANFNSENMSLSSREGGWDFSNLEWIVKHAITKAKWIRIIQLIGFE